MSRMQLAKRIMAMALALSLVMTTLGSYVPGWFTAFADENEPQIAIQAESDPASDPERDDQEGPGDDLAEEAAGDQAVPSELEANADALSAEDPDPTAPAEDTAQDADTSDDDETDEDALEPTDNDNEAVADEQESAESDDEAVADEQEPAEGGEADEETREPVANSEDEIMDNAQAPAAASDNGEDDEDMQQPVAESDNDVTVEDEQAPAEGDDVTVEDDQEPIEGAAADENDQDTDGAETEEALVNAEEEAQEEDVFPDEATAEGGEEEGARTLPPQSFNLAMTTPALPQAEGESADPDEAVVSAEPVLEIANAAASMAAASGDVVLLGEPPEEERVSSPANAGGESEGEQSAAPETADRAVALQQLIMDKLSSLKNLSGIVQIVLAKNTTFEGDVEIQKADDQTVEDDFQLQLVAEDALDGNGDAIEAGGSGKTVVSGNMKIGGISVLMRGVMMALGKKITVSNAVLNYEGTDGVDALEVELAQNGSAQIQTYGDDDNVSVTLYDGARSAAVDTGAGDDKVSVTAYDGSVSVDTGAGDDTVGLNTQGGAGAARVDTGEGSDRVEARAASGGGADIRTGDGADRVEIDAQFGSDNIRVDTGAGDDRVSVTKTDDLYSAPSGTMTIDLGEGASRLDVDLSVGKGYVAIDARADGNSGSRLHLTGSLNSDTGAVAEDRRIEWASEAKDAIVLHPSNGTTLTVGVQGFSSMTDDLENKREVKVSKANGNYQDFTNYVLDNATDTDGVKSWNGGASAPEGLTLANLVLGKAKEDIQVGDVDATGFNLLIQGKEIDLSGAIQANNIVVAARDEHTNELIDPNSESLLDKAGDILSWVAHSFDENIVRTAVINVKGSAELRAANDIDLKAEVKQSGGLLQNDLIAMIVNPVNVKIGTAQVNIGSGAELKTERGSIAAEAKVSTDMTAGKAKVNLPVAVNVAVQNASVLVEKDATLNAGRNISINAESRIKAAAESTSEIAPFAVAVDVILNNATADVAGQLFAGGDVTVSALGEMTSGTTARHSGDGLSGVYLGTNVALQNVRARLSDSATVYAGGAVDVRSVANMKANTVAKSGADAPKAEEESEFAAEKKDSGFGKTADLGIGMAKEYIGGFAGKIWEKLKHGVVSIFKNDPTDWDKMQKQLESVAGGEYTVKLAEDSEQKGDVKFVKVDSAEGKYTDIEITPWDGHQVDKVYYVYLDNRDGEDAANKYTVVEAIDGSDADDNVYRIYQRNANVLVYVTYKDGESAADDVDTWTPDDLFSEQDDDYGQDLQSLFDDATSGAQDSDAGAPADDSAEEDGADKLKFAIEPTETTDEQNKRVGAILNTNFSKTTGESATTVAKGGKVTFVVNARGGYKLKDDGLVVTYYVQGEDKEQKAVLKDDGNGRYTFAVPEGILTDHYDDGVAFKIVSEFEKKDAEADSNVDQTQTQVNGSVAVTVAMNDNRALIDGGSVVVNARDEVNVTANGETRVNTNTDGTGVVKNPEKAEEKKEKKQEEQQKLLSGQYIVTGKEVSLTLDQISGGTVDAQQKGAYGYTFTPRQNGQTVTGVTATLRYQKDGKWESETLVANDDGTYSLNLTDYTIDKGTQAVLGFAMPGSSGETQAKRDLVDYTMNVSYNVFQLSKEEDPYNVGNRKIGSVYFVKTAGEGADTKYYFDIRPDWASGYTMDGASESSLWASYTDAGGAERKVALRQDSASNYWYVLSSDLAGIAQGGNVTVNVRFTEDKHELVANDASHGRLTFSEASAKASDVVTVQAAPDKNYGAGRITVHYTAKNTGLTRTVALTPDENGEAKFTMPVLADGTKVYFSAEFNEKTLTLINANAGSVRIDTSARASAGEKIAVALTGEAAAAGKKLNDTAEITYTPREGQRKTVQVSVKDGRISLPDDVQNGTDVQIAVNAVDKAIALDGGEARLAHGTLKIASSRADKGEKVVVNITPEAGYRFKQGSGTAEITTGTSTYKVKLTRRDDSSLTFTMPSSMTSAEIAAAQVSVALNGTFEKGLPDSSTYQTSVGAAASVAVVTAKNEAVISGWTIVSDAVNVNAVTVGESNTSASAGYSKAVTGLAGGFGVQVASFATKALVKETARIETKSLVVSAKGAHGLETTGSAAGAKDAASTGVGSGIAVNVSSADVAAAIQDGAGVTARNGMVQVSAANKTTDKVTAKAGAKGDTGVTPVIGVDVFGSSASAYLGKLTGSSLAARTVIVTAENIAAHDMTADASTGGGSVALGGAFAVNVIHDEARALLNKGIISSAKDGAVTVSAIANTTQSVTATAGVSGGVKGAAGKDGAAGSADKQVDSILGGAGNIAAGSRSSSLSLKGSGSADRQKAQTSEGSVGGAAAVAVNVLSTSAVARIGNGVTINTAGALAVRSVNRTQTKVKANGSTAKTDTGVGVAVAVNIVDIENIAEIGSGTVRAASLEVSALMPEKADNTADETASVKMPESRDAMVAQLAGYIQDGINDALSELGVDQSVIGELAATFSETFVNYVLQETGLEELLGDGTFDEKVQKVLSDLNDLWESVKEYPTVLLEPLSTLKDEITALEDLDTDNLQAVLLGEMKTQLPNMLKNTVVAVLNRAKDDLGSLALEALNNKLKGKDQSSTKEKAKQTLINAVKAEWTTLSSQLMTDALTRLRSEVPVLTEQNIDAIKSAFTTSLDQKKDSFVNYFTDNFQSKVFNYSAVMDKISNTDFKAKAVEILRGALNASAANVGNAAIESLVSNLDVQIVPEDVSDKHVIRTESIAGAAAKDAGIAGSVALTTVNANTRAAVNSGNTMNITGAALVDAREARRVATTASAALDAKGNADTNKDAGKKEEKDTAGSNATPTVHLGEQLEVKSAAGATLEQDASDKDIVWITARDGWKISTGADKAKWSYTDDKGVEKTGNIEVYSKQVDGETRYYVKASDATTVSGALTTVTITPEEDLHTISGLDAISLSEDSATSKVPDGAVSVTVEGRDEAVRDGKLSARTTDTVKIAIDKAKLKGLTVDSIDYITADGKIHEVPLSATENGSEIVFTFAMPAQNVTGILVTVDKAEESDSAASKTAATDRNGRSVGVGASFAMVYGDSRVIAEIARSVNADSLTVNAGSDHAENTSSVSGTDALSGELNVDAMKKTSVDASVALDILDNAVRAVLTNTVTTKKGDLALTAREAAVSETRASGYAVGSETAVGAAVAVNIVSSSVEAQAQKALTVAGSAKIDASSHSEDVTRALATAMGADVARAMNKVGEAAENLEEKSNDLLEGKLFDGKTDGGSNRNNETADKINGRLDKKKAQGGEDSSKNLSLSSNALRNQNVTTNSEDAGSEGTDEALSQVQENGGVSLGGAGSDTKSKVQVAAAVGVTVASHEAAVKVGKVTADGAISATAENAGNFHTMGTGAAMSLAEKANAIALGVAVSVNGNKATVASDGDLVASKGGDVTLASKLTANMDGSFLGKLAAQALSGSVAGKDSTISLAGAVSVLVSEAESGVKLEDAKVKEPRKIQGGSVTIEATDKSKLTARAGGVSLSRGSSAGMGIASANVVSGNAVTARVGNYTEIIANSFKLNAEKQAVTDEDYKSNIDMRYLITDSSALSDEERKEANTGLIDVHKGEDDDSYTVDMNLSSDKLLDAVDALNFLSAQNTYVEAIAGSVATGKTKASLAGSIVVAVARNKVEASTGSGVRVTLTRSGDKDGGMTVNAENGTTTRIIAGSVSAAPAKAAVGATVAVLVDSDSVVASTGRDASIDIDGDFAQTATTSGDIQLFTGAMGVSTGVEGSANAAGGAVNVIVTKNITESTVGSGTNIASDGSVRVASRTALDLMAISLSANVSASANSSVAAGGTVNVIVDRSTSDTTLDGGNTVAAAKDLSLTSDVSDQLISGTASLSAALSSSGKTGAGVVNVIVAKSAARTTAGLNTALEATRGNVKTTANNDAWLLNAGLAAAGGSDKALGGAVSVNVFERSAVVSMASGAITAGGSLISQASGRDTDIMAGLSLAAAGTGAAVSGNVVVAVMKSKIQNLISEGVTATAGGSAVMESYYGGLDVAAAGNATGSITGDAVGLVSVTLIRGNDVRTQLAGSAITARGSAAFQNLSGAKVSGVYAGANALERQFVGAAGIAASAATSVNGTVAVLVNNNKVIANASEATLRAEAADIGVEANDDTLQFLLAGGVNVSASAGVGAAVTTLVSNKEIQAVARNMDAKNNVSVQATNKDDVTQLSVSAGVSGGAAVQIGAAVQVLKSRATAHVGTIADDGETKTAAPGAVRAQSGSFRLNAQNDTALKNLAVTVAASGSAAVTPVGVVTYFQGEADARLREGTTVAAAKDISVTAAGKKDIDMLSVGAAAGGMGISGTVNVLVSKEKTRAIAETGTKLGDGNSAAGSVNIEAQNDYTLRSVSGAIAGGSAGVAVNAVVSVLKSNTTAELGGAARATGKVNVKADNTRDVLDVVGTGSVGGTGVGVTAMVLVSGAKMSQDAADMVAYGNADSKSKENATFDAGTFMANAEANGVASKYYTDEDETDEDRKLSGAILAEDISGNGHRESENSVGTQSMEEGRVQEGDDEATIKEKQEKKPVGKFDGDSGYRSASLEQGNITPDDDSAPGADLEGKDSADVARAKELNTYTYDGEPSDQVVARITSTGAVEQAEGVSVTADQKVSADLFGATVAAGGVGVGVSAAVAVLHSNVSASSAGAIRNVGDKGIEISARSESGAVASDDGAQERDSALEGVLEDLDPSNHAIRAIGVSVGAGEVGVAVGVSVVLTDNVTQAVLGGKVDTDGNTSVTATHDYGNVLAATAAVSGGGVAAGASVSVAQANGSVKAEVAGKANVATRDLTVGTDTNVNVNALAATAGAGMVSINGGVALALNRLEQSTGIRKGANVTATGDMNLTAASRTTADSALLGMSFGGVGAALSAAVSDLDAQIDTAIDGATVKTGGKLTVRNDIASAATPKVLSIAGGAVGVSGNALLAFNDSKAAARIDDSNITAGSLDVISDLAGKGESSLASLAVGMGAIGASVNYVDLSAANEAAVRGGTVDVAGDMSVRTGVGENHASEAIAETIAGNIGYLAVGMNAAIARNNTKNYAILSDVEKLSVGKALTVHASGSASTDAGLMGLGIGLADASASVVVSMNEADNRTVVNAKNVEVGGMSTFNATQNASTDSWIRTGGGSLVGLKVNVAGAYGRAASVVDVTLDNAGKEGGAGLHGITAVNSAADAVNAKVTNQSYSVLSAAAMVGVAYSQDVVSTRVKLSGDNTIDGDVDLRTNYVATGDADVTPSAGGVDASLASLGVNIGLARNTAYAGTTLESAGGTNTIAGDLNVVTEGAASTSANIHSARITVKTVGIGVNVVKSDLSATQAAQIALDGGALHVGGDAGVRAAANNIFLMSQRLKTWKAEGSDALKSVDVETLSDSEVESLYRGEVRALLKTWKAGGNATLSDVDIDALSDDQVENYYVSFGGPRIQDALASSAIVGSSGGDEIDVELIKVVTNHAYARENMASTAAVTGKGGNKLTVDGDMRMFAGVEDGVKTSSLSRTDGALEVSILSVGNLDGEASSNDSFNVALTGVDVNVGGDARFQARTDTSAEGHGTSPGGLKLIGVGVSNIKAGVGTKDAKETAKVLLDDKVRLTANTISMEALNQGATEATYKKGLSVSVAEVGVSSQPTESYYDTGVAIGSGAVVTAKGNVAGAGEYALSIASETRSQAKSEVSARQIAAGFNVEVMEGSNTIHDDNIIDIGKGAKLDSVGSMSIRTLNNTSASSETDLMGIGGLFSGTFSGATNTIDRVGRINILDGASLTTRNGAMDLTTTAGTADHIHTWSNADSGGLIAVGTGSAVTNLSSENSINIGKNVNLISARDMNLIARSTSHQASGEAGVDNTSNVDVGGLAADIDSRAKLNLWFSTAVNINKGNTEPTQLQSTGAGSNITVRVDNAGLKATNEARGVGGGPVGFAIADATIDARLQNNIWVDKANLYPEGTVTLLATNAPEGEAKPHFKAAAYAKLTVAGGTLTSNAIVKGDAHNQVKSSDTNLVATTGKFVHIAVDPSNSIQEPELSATYSVNSGLTRVTSEAEIYWEAMKYRCDFCAEGHTVTPKDPKAGRGTALDGAMKKALAPLSEINRMVAGLGNVTKARYGDEDVQATGQIYVLDVETLLRKDVTFGEERLEKYQMWTNVQTQHNVALLPNATRLLRSMKLDYVSEVLRGDVRGDGESYLIDIFTALNAKAFRNPIIPIGSTGSLNFATGVFTLPDLADFELYLHEVSGAWMLQKLCAGVFRRMDADQAQVNAYALDDGSAQEQTLPTGPIVEVLAEDGESDGWKKYWLGDTPETAQDDSQVLIYLLWNEETDEIDAFRTSLAMIAAGDGDIDVSLYIFRDSRSDRRGEEKYNILFFDTPAGEKSLVKLITNVLEGRTLEVPKPIQIVLRGMWMDGADYQAYSLSDHFFALCDGTDGAVDLFGDFYRATFDGDTFESDYTKIEGILNNDLTVTIKKDQPIWPEWTSANTAEDIQGDAYVQVDGEWTAEEENEDTHAA